MGASNRPTLLNLKEGGKKPYAFKKGWATNQAWRNSPREHRPTQCGKEKISRLQEKGGKEGTQGR